MTKFIHFVLEIDFSDLTKMLSGFERFVIIRDYAKL